MHNLIIYGGTFDPIHYGHIKTALNVQARFKFDRFVFLPCKIPLLKNQAHATSAQRVKMIQLAIDPYAQQQNFALDFAEMNRETPSYMVETLLHFRTRYGEKLPITVLMGEDAFNDLPHWYQWSRLITLANNLVIKRAGFAKPYSQVLASFVQSHETLDGNRLKMQAQGLVYRFNAGEFSFSSSWLRQQIVSGEHLQDYLPEAVLDYIKKNNIYSALRSH